MFKRREAVETKRSGPHVGGDEYHFTPLRKFVNVFHVISEKRSSYIALCVREGNDCHSCGVMPPQCAQHSRRLPDPLARQPSAMLRRCCASCKEALLAAHHARKLPPFRAVRNHDDGVPATEWMAMPFGPRLCCLSSSCSMVPADAGFMSGNGFQYRALDQRMFMPVKARFRCWKAPSGSAGRMPALCVRRTRPGSARLPAQRSPRRRGRLPPACRRRNGCRAK